MPRIADRCAAMRGYYMAAVAVAPETLASSRRKMSGLVLPGQRRLHFCKEKDARRDRIVRAIALLGVQVVIFDASSTKNQKIARDQCLSALVDDLAKRQAARLVLERDDSTVRSDRRLLARRCRHTDHSVAGTQSTACPRHSMIARRSRRRGPPALPPRSGWSACCRTPRSRPTGPPVAGLACRPASRWPTSSTATARRLHWSGPNATIGIDDGPRITHWILVAGVVAFCGTGASLAGCGWSYRRRSRAVRRPDQPQPPQLNFLST